MGDEIDVEDSFEFFFETGKETYIPVLDQMVAQLILFGATWKSSDGVSLERTSLDINPALVKFYDDNGEKSAAGLKVIAKASITAVFA